MRDLRSISKPVQALESQESAGAVEAPRKLLPGETGAVHGGSNRAAEHLLVKGKAQPIRHPQPPGMGLIESVIGADDRTRILETEADPWRMICALRIRSPFGTLVGTGWFAGPKTLVTAGHCVYHEAQMGGWADRIEVSPGRNGRQFPFQTVEPRRFSTLSRWVESADPDFDIGAIHLDAPAGERGWFSVGALPSGELEGFQVNISGYPADRGRGTEQWFHANRVLKVSSRRIFYDVDTFGGQSGSPVWIYETEQSQPMVVGIHAYGIGGTPATMGITANSAPRILPEIFDIIAAWVEEDGT